MMTIAMLKAGLVEELNRLAPEAVVTLGNDFDEPGSLSVNVFGVAPEAVQEIEDLVFNRSLDHLEETSLLLTPFVHDLETTEQHFPAQAKQIQHKNLVKSWRTKAARDLEGPDALDGIADVLKPWNTEAVAGQLRLDDHGGIGITLVWSKFQSSALGNEGVPVRESQDCAANEELALAA